MTRTLYLIDGHAQIFRAYYAPFGNLTAPDGEPTRATHVFCQMLLNLLRDRRPDYLAMVLDAGEEKLFRRAIYPDYKAQRDPAPEDLHVQERRIVEILQTARVPLLRLEEFEADDIIATLAARFAGPDLHVCIVSRDKDLDQLLTDHVSLYDPQKDELLTPADLLATKGWTPAQAVEAQILTGDSVDNVPGVPGIGPKTAAKLLQKYGSAAAVVAHAADLTPKQRENVLAFAPRIDLVRQLVTLRADAPVDLDLAAADTARFNWPAARPILERLGFRRLCDQLPAASATDEPPQVGVGENGVACSRGTPREHADVLFPDDGVNAPIPNATAQPEPADTRTPADTQRPASRPTPQQTDPILADLHQRAAALREPAAGRYDLINTPAALDELIARLAGQPEFAVDTETTDINAIDADLCGISLAWEVGRACYIPVLTQIGTALPLALVRDKLGPLLADPARRKIGQNIKYDLIVLRNAGLPVAGPLFDTMIAAFVLDPLRTSYGVDKLVFDWFGYRKIPTTDLLGKGRDQLRMDQVPVAHVAEYASEDADYTWRLSRLFAPALAPAGVDRLFHDVEMPLVNVLTDMEFHGIALDVGVLADMGRQMAARISAITDEVHALTGTLFNLDSPKQLAEVLFDQLKFRVVRRTKTARSTDADTLDTLARETGHPLPGLLLEYRELQKLRGTYVDTLPRVRSRRTGRIHTSYHQTGAVTGRLSSSEPNLQNIPIRTELGRQIRRAFVPRSPDERLIVADYSQVELRVLAHLSEDEALTRAFIDDRDIHAFVASQVNGVPLDAVTREMRAHAKAVNFGIVYGQTAFGLAQGTGMSRAEAQAFIDAYFARYPRIADFIRQCVAQARRDGAVRTILGRRRPILDIDSRNATARAQAERLAVNTVVQGSAADLIKIAMNHLHARIAAERLPLRMLLQVHDELVCEAPAATAPTLATVVSDVMSSALSLRVPLKVDISVAPNWLEAK